MEKSESDGRPSSLWALLEAFEDFHSCAVERHESVRTVLRDREVNVAVFEIDLVPGRRELLRLAHAGVQSDVELGESTLALILDAAG